MQVAYAHDTRTKALFRRPLALDTCGSRRIETGYKLYPYQRWLLWISMSFGQDRSFYSPARDEYLRGGISPVLRIECHLI
jgi:hypothetical protein